MSTEKKPSTPITLPALLGTLDRLRVDMDAVHAWHTWRDDSPHAHDIARTMKRAIVHADALRLMLERVHLRRGPHAPPVTCCRHGIDTDAEPPCKHCEREREFHIGGSEPSRP